MSDVEYWNRHAKNYERSMLLLGGPVPRVVEGSRPTPYGALSRVLAISATRKERSRREPCSPALLAVRLRP